MDARILIIDNEPSQDLTLVKILERAHYAAVSVSSSEQGLAILSSHPYDLIVFDIHRQDVDGLHLLHQIRRIFPGLKVLVFTTDSDVHTIQYAYQAGASGYLIKPVDPQALLQKIDDLLHHHHSFEKWKTQFIGENQSISDDHWLELHPRAYLTERIRLKQLAAECKQQGARLRELSQELLQQAAEQRRRSVVLCEQSEGLRFQFEQQRIAQDQCRQIEQPAILYGGGI